MPKKLSNSDLIGKAGVSLVGLRLAEIGFLFHESGSVEAGTDGFVEVRNPESGEMLSAVFRLQSKATKNGRAWHGETDRNFEFSCKERDIADWVRSNVPVVLVCADVSRQIAFWKDVTTYFKDSAKRESRRVTFDKERDRFDGSAGAALAAIAVPEPAGTHIPPPRKKEELISNLLPVDDHPRELWVAPALVTKMWEVERILREAETGVECFVRGSQLYSFRPPEGHPWDELCEVDAAEKFDATKWSQADDPVKQREFAELLRRSLGEKVRDWMDYDRREQLFYFRASEDLAEVKLPGGRRVFRAYFSRNGKLRYYRHLGFHAQFLRLDGCWHLEINPQYRFTKDGSSPSRYQGEAISKMKRLERNDAVRQQVQAISSFLRQPATLLTPEYRFLSFGPPLAFEVDFGFDESAWHRATQGQPDSSQLSNAA